MKLTIAQEAARELSLMVENGLRLQDGKADWFLKQLVKVVTERRAQVRLTEYIRWLESPVGPCPKIPTHTPRVRGARPMKYLLLLALAFCSPTPPSPRVLMQGSWALETPMRDYTLGSWVMVRYAIAGSDITIIWEWSPPENYADYHGCINVLTIAGKWREVTCPEKTFDTVHRPGFEEGCFAVDFVVADGDQHGCSDATMNSHDTFPRTDVEKITNTDYSVIPRQIQTDAAYLDYRRYIR